MLLYVLLISIQSISSRLFFDIYCSNYTVQSQSNYQFKITLTNNLSIPANSQIKIYFPPQYSYAQSKQILAIPVIIVYQDKFNGTIQNNILTIQEAFPDDINANFDFTILNITNPMTSGSYNFTFAIENINQIFAVTINPGNLDVTAKFDPNFTNSISQLNIQVKPYHKIPKSGKLRIKIKKIWSQFLGKKNIPTIQTNTTCSSNTNTSENLRCDIDDSDPLNFTLIVYDIFDNDNEAGNNFSIIINNVLSPPTVLTSLDQFTIETLDASDNTIDKNQVQIQELVATPMNISFDSTNIKVGTKKTLIQNIVIEFKQIIIQQDTIQLKFPQNIIYEDTNEIRLIENNIMQISNIIGSNYAQKIISFTILNFLQNTTIIQNRTINMSLIINITIPWTTQPNQIIITFKRNNAQYLNVTGTLTPQTNNLDVKLQLQTTQINKSTKYEFQLNPESIMNRSAYLNITFPNQINIQNASNCMKKNITSEYSCDFEIQNQSIKITNLFEGYSGNDKFYVSFQNISNPSKVKNIGPFLITTYSSQNLYKIDQDFTLNFTTTQGILDTTKIVISSDSPVVNQLTNYTINLTILNQVSSLSQIHIQFPKQFQVDSLNTCQVNSKNCGCLKNASNQKVILFSFLSFEQNFTSGDIVQIKIGNIRNPKSTQLVNGINIQIFNDCQSNEICNESNLQDIGLNLSHNVSQPSLLFLTIRTAQKINGYQIEYNFDIIFDYPIENHSILNITFPQSMSVTNTNCSITIISQLTLLQCTYQASSRILTINIQTQIIQGLHTISVSKIKNAKSLKKNELKLELFLSDETGTTIVQKRENFGITNDKTGLIDTVEITINPSILGQESNITMNVALKNSLDSSCFMEVQFPDSYKLNDSLQCNDVRIKCSDNKNNILIIQIKQDIDDQLNFKVSTITNPLQFKPYNAYFRIITYLTYQSRNFTIDQGSIPYQFKKLCQQECRTCDEQNQYYCISCYNNPLITNHNNLQNNKCVQKCNDRYYQQNDICKQCVSTCYTCSSNQTCLSCDTSGEFSYFHNNTCTANCPANYFSNSDDDKVCLKCPLECLSCSSLLSCSNCSQNYYLNQEKCVKNCPSGFYAQNSNQGRICSRCNQQCLQCELLPQKCTICKEGYIRQNPTNNTSRCINQCPGNNQAIHSGRCQNCSPNCQTCSVSIYTCLSCWQNSKQKFLHTSKSCRISCSTNQYADQNNICISCPYCLTCNISACFSCQSSYFLQNGQCKESCTPDYYVAEGMICIQCQGLCQKCKNIKNNCTSCKEFNLDFNQNLDINTCVQYCPPSKIPVDNICTQCLSPCQQCKNNVSYCTKCVNQTYLFQNECNDTCPSAFYKNQVSRVCQQCLTNCIECNNSYQCIECNSTYFLQKKICVENCTQGYENGNECSPCPNQKCKKCRIPDVCDQCYKGFLLAEDGVCYNQCPEQYPVQQDNQCVKCPSDCFQCDSKGMCLQCGINFYVFKGKCVSECPQFYQLSADKKSCLLNLIQNSLNAFTKSPFPILIVTGLCLISIFISKFQASQTILSACIIGIVSILQLSAWLYLLILYSSSITELNKQIILLITGICFLIILNIIHFVFYFKFLSKDQTFIRWKQKKWNRISNYIVLIFSLFTFKAYHFIYSRYFGFETFSASWKKITQLFPLDVLGIISIFLNSLIMIIGASLIAYEQNKKNYFSQVFIQSLEVIIVQVLMIIFLICNVRKNEKMFKGRENKYTSQYTANNLDYVNQNYQLIQENNKGQKKNVFINQNYKKGKEQQNQESKIDQFLHQFEFEANLNQNQNNQDQLKQYTLKDQQKNQINQKVKNKKKNKKKKTKQSTQKGKGQNQVQNIQHLELSSVDNKKKTIQLSENQEIKNKIQNPKKNINPAISKQKPNKLNKVPFISYQETKQTNKNHLNSDEDPSFLQNKMIQDQQKIKKILKSPKKINNNYKTQFQIQNKQQQNQQNSNSKLKQFKFFFENQQANNGNQINHTKEAQIYKQIDFKQMNSQYLNNLQFEDEISPNQQKHNRQYIDQKFTNLQNKFNNNFHSHDYSTDKKTSQIFLQNKNMTTQKEKYLESLSQNDLQINQISPTFFNQLNQRFENELFENKNKNKELNCQQIKIDPMQKQDYQYEEIIFQKPSNIKKKQVDNQQPFQLKRHQNYFQRNKKQQQQMIVDYPMPNFQNQRYEQNYKQQKDHGKQNNNRLKSLQKIYLQRLNVKNKSIPKQFYKK